MSRSNFAGQRLNMIGCLGWRRTWIVARSQSSSRPAAPSRQSQPSPQPRRFQLFSRSAAIPCRWAWSLVSIGPAAIYGLVLQPDPETRPAASVREIDVAHPSERKGSGFELEVVMSPAKPATDPDSAIFTASMA